MLVEININSLSIKYYKYPIIEIAPSFTLNASRRTLLAKPVYLSSTQDSSMIVASPPHLPVPITRYITVVLVAFTDIMSREPKGIKQVEFIHHWSPFRRTALAFEENRQVQ